MQFDTFGLSKTLEKSIFKMGFLEPTPVQEQSIPIALKGMDILGSAQTGTGKTGAFSIPLIQKLMRDETATALVLTPTRELAKQVLEVITELLYGQNAINLACLIGGEQITKQLKQLRRRPRIIVGTPGRINDHIDRKSLKLNQVKFLVLDETDRMLDMGFGTQVDRILKNIPKERQTLMFSATLPEQIVKLSTKYLTSPQRISIGKSNVVAVNINNEIIKIKKENKYELLLDQLEKREGSVLLFVKTKHGTVKMAKNLRNDHFISEPLNGNLRQSKRDRVMKNFRDKKFKIMVATDIAARGLDVPHIEHVINYDLPQLAEDYIHRLGRTGRANAIGSAVTFISSKELDKWNEIERILDPELRKVERKNKRTSLKKDKKFQSKRKSKRRYTKSKSDDHDKKDSSQFYKNKRNNKKYKSKDENDDLTPRKKRFSTKKFKNEKDLDKRSFKKRSVKTKFASKFRPKKKHISKTNVRQKHKKRRHKRKVNLF